MNNNEDNILVPEELLKVTGGALPKGADARVFSRDGGDVKMYETTYDGFGYFWTVPNGSQMQADGTLLQYKDDGPKKCSPFYWAKYNHKWLKIKDCEVTIQWV